MNKSPLIVVRGGPPECPLCGNKMREIFYHGHVFYTCTREHCMISVNKNDPLIKIWPVINDPKNAPKCQFCHKPVKIFVRKDGVKITQCRDKSHYPYQVARGDARALPPLE